ncbi:MAG: hypothetical protein R6V19_04910, partial [Armatimonadota bacterium]
PHDGPLTHLHPLGVQLVHRQCYLEDGEVGELDEFLTLTDLVAFPYLGPICPSTSMKMCSNGQSG